MSDDSKTKVEYFRIFVFSYFLFSRRTQNLDLQIDTWVRCPRWYFLVFTLTRSFCLPMCVVPPLRAAPIKTKRVKKRGSVMQKKRDAGMAELIPILSPAPVNEHTLVIFLSFSVSFSQQPSPSSPPLAR